MTEIQETEKFDTKTPDSDLASLITSWEKESEEFYGVWKSVIRQNLAYYHGNQTDLENIRGKDSKAVENRIFMAIETIIPIATARLPQVIVTPMVGEENEEAVKSAIETQDVIAYHFERVGFQAKAELFLRDLLIKRYGVFKLCWNEGSDEFDLLRVDPKRIRVPKYGASVRGLKFIMEDLEKSYEGLVEYFGKETADKIKNMPQAKIPQSSDDPVKVRAASYLVREVWTNDTVAWKVGQEIVKKKANPYYDFDEEGNNQFDSPTKPYVIKSLFETDESIIGDTDYIQQTLHLQDHLNERKRQAENAIRRGANPTLRIDSQVMTEEEAGNITNEPGQILYGNGAAEENKVRWDSGAQISPAIFQDVADSRQALDNIIGTHSTTRGEREGRETLGGRQMLREADLGRIDLIGRQIERAVDEVGEWMLQMMKMFYTTEKGFTLMSEDGFRFIKGFTGKQIGKVKLAVRPGSTLKEDDTAIKQQAILLWQNKAIGIRTLYKMLKMPDVQGAMDDFIQTQSGAILRPTQPATPMMGGQENAIPNEQLNAGGPPPAMGV